MEAEGRARVKAASHTGPVRVHRSVDMRYGEQIFEVNVNIDDIELDDAELLSRLARAFHVRHDELYTYSLPDQDPVLVNARVAVVGELPQLPHEPHLTARPSAEPSSHRRIYLDGWRNAPVFQLDGLAAGQTVAGIAIIESPMTTVLLRPGETATTTSTGWLDIKIPPP